MTDQPSEPTESGMPKGASRRRRPPATAPTRQTPARSVATRPARGARLVSAGDSAAHPANLEHVEAEHIEVHQGSIRSATARSVTVQQGAVGGVRADEVNVAQGALGGVRAQRVSLDRGALGGAVAGSVSVRQGYVRAILARDVTIEQGGVRSVIANHVTLGRQAGAFLVIARSVDGMGRTMVDWRGALAFGAAFAVVTAFLRRRVAGR